LLFDISGHFNNENRAGADPKERVVLIHARLEPLQRRTRPEHHLSPEDQLPLRRRVSDREVVPDHRRRRQLVLDRVGAQAEVEHLPAADQERVGDQPPVTAPPLRLRSCSTAHGRRSVVSTPR
jgi:hypothetical protein